MKHLSLALLFHSAWARHHPRGVTLLQDNGVIGTDDISNASNDEMFAFSEIISAGGSVQQTVAQIENEAKEAKRQAEAKAKTAWEVAAKAKKNL